MVQRVHVQRTSLVDKVSRLYSLHAVANLA
jgi:hypothetical protein